MIWSLFALTASLLHTGYGYANERFKLSGLVLNFYRGAVPFLVLAPLFPFIDLPSAWPFYALTAANGSIVAFSDTRFFDATARYGSAPVLRLKPLVLVLVFLFWLPLDGQRTAQLFGNPLLASGILGTLGVAAVSLFFMTRSAISYEAFRFYLPALLASGLIDPINKMTTRYSHGLSGAVSYAAFTSLFVFLFLMPQTILRRKTFGQANSVRYLGAGLTIGFLSVAFNVAKNLAMAWTPNPAFVTAFIFCSGLWATLFVRLRGRTDEYNVKAGVIFVGSAIALVLLGANY